MATDEMIGKVDEMIGKVLANQWEVVELLGEGGVGSVYLGRDKILKTFVAIKVLNPRLRGDPESVVRFEQEVAILEQNAHPNIAEILGYDFSTDNPYLVMEFLNGLILKTVLEESPGHRLHPQRIRRIFTQILDALGMVHERGVIHRDLKPENVFILKLGSGWDNTDVVRLIDFGIAKLRGNGVTTKPGLTQVGLVLGTPFYMSPEQCRGNEVDNRTDIYAVGVMLYEAATGRLPFNKPTHPEIMVAHLNECPDAPAMINPGLSYKLEMIILRALAKDPAARFQSAEEFSKALAAAIPEESSFYRDSQRVPSISGRTMVTPPRIPTPTPADDEKPTAKKLVDVSRTPTRLFSERRPAAGIALAQTVTPSGLKREMLKIKLAAMVRGSVRSGGAWMAATAWKIARKADPWLSKPRSSHARYFHAFLIFVVALGLSIFFIPIGGGEANASVDDADADASIVAEVADTAATPDTVDALRRDVVVIRMPIILPPPERDAGIDTSEDAGTTEIETEADATDIPLPDTLTPAETLPDATDIETADDYLDRIAEARRIANWRRATARLEELIRKWPERPEAWEALGDTLVTAPGQTERARDAYTRCLELLPRGALTKRALVEGKLRGLK